MKTINNFINEKLKISSKSNIYTCHPKYRFVLRKILEERLAKDKNADLNDIDVSKIIDMGCDSDCKGLFQDLDPHDIDISLWDVSNVTNMQSMFYQCKNFTGKGLENWNVSKVINMANMFEGCIKFNCDLSSWDVSNVHFATTMFMHCNNFKGKDLENWNVTNIEYANMMFYGCEKLNFDASNWDLKNAYGQRGYVFDGCTSLKKFPSWYK